MFHDWTYDNDLRRIVLEQPGHQAIEELKRDMQAKNAKLKAEHKLKMDRLSKKGRGRGKAKQKAVSPHSPHSRRSAWGEALDATTRSPADRHYRRSSRPRLQCLRRRLLLSIVQQRTLPTSGTWTSSSPSATPRPPPASCDSRRRRLPGLRVPRQLREQRVILPSCLRSRLKPRRRLSRLGRACRGRRMARTQRREVKRLNVSAELSNVHSLCADTYSHL